MKTLFDAFVEIGVSPADDPATRQKKLGLTSIALICGPAALLIGIGLLALGYPIPALIPFAYVCISIPSLFHFAHTKNVRIFQYSQLILIQLLPFVLTWSMGGLNAASLVMVWGAFAPIAALIFFDQRAARFWLLGFVGLTAVSVLVDHHVSAWAIPLHWAARDLFYFLNIGGASAGLWFVVSYHVAEKERLNKRLLDELDRREQTQAEVIRQKQKADELGQMLQAVLDNIPVRIFWKDRDLRYIGCNTLFAQDAGQDSPQGVLGKTDLELNWRGSSTLAHRNELQVIETGQARIKVEERRANADGSISWLRTSSVPLRDTDGAVFGMLGMYEDITLEKNTELELIKAKTSAEAASHAKGNFLARMSHEIRTPMNAILGLAYVLEHEVTDAAQRERLAKITDSATHLLDLLNDILDFSKIEANSLELEEIPLSIPATLEAAANMMRDLASEKALELITEIDPTLHDRPLLGDPLRIRQILINFTNNAIKFTHQGSITISARIEESFGDRIRIRFEVTDTGIGVPELAQARIFNAFEQADTGTTREYGGSGLGLSIAKGFAALMGGEVGLNSHSGAGSTFWFTALLRHAAVEPLAPVKPDVSLRQGARVLMVEDNEINQEVAMALLQRMGLVVDIANHGEEALEKVLGSEYDLVLMDMWMPVMDGLEATRSIRALGKTMPIVAMTANAMQQDKDNCSAAGMDDFIQKPVDPKKLQSSLAKWIPATP